jgi:hypothetical protein
MIFFPSRLTKEVIGGKKEGEKTKNKKEECGDFLRPSATNKLTTDATIQARSVNGRNWEPRRSLLSLNVKQISKDKNSRESCCR